MRIFTVENLRFPGEGSSAQGKSGPKARPRGVADGQQVEIPVLPLLVIREVGTQEDKSSERLEELVQAQRIDWQANPPVVSEA